jgi:hypothetical protein
MLRRASMTPPLSKALRDTREEFHRHREERFDALSGTDPEVRVRRRQMNDLTDRMTDALTSWQSERSLEELTALDLDRVALLRHLREWAIEAEPRFVEPLSLMLEAEELSIRLAGSAQRADPIFKSVSSQIEAQILPEVLKAFSRDASGAAA